MKILHTADWHLNDKLGKEDRTGDLRDRVEQVAECCEAQEVDVLLIAGDLFSEQATPDQIADSFRHLRATFSAFFDRGGVILAVTGNHDQDRRVYRPLEVARTAMMMADTPVQRGSRFRPGRMYLIDGTFFGKIRDERNGFDVQFVLLPYPSASRYLDDPGGFTTTEEMNRRLQAKIAECLRELPAQPGYDLTARTVLVAHLNVAGADLGRGLFRLSEQNDVVLDAGFLPTGFDYIALGHIHKPQCLGGLAHVRYSGSLDRLDFGERDEDKGVVLVDIGPAGRQGDPVSIPIPPTPMVDLTVTETRTTADDLRVQVSEADRALVRVSISPAAALEAGDAIDRALRDGLGRVTRVHWQPSATTEDPIPQPNASTTTTSTSTDFRANVLDYLGRLPADDPHRDELLRLAEEFLDEETRS